MGWCTAIASAGALPSSQSALPGSEAASARLGTPRCDALGPASRRARKGNSPPSPRNGLLPRPTSGSPRLRPHHGSRSASGARAPSSTPRGPGSRAAGRSKVEESYGERVRDATLGMRVASIQRGGVSVVTQEAWAKLGAGPASRWAPEVIRRGWWAVPGPSGTSSLSRCARSHPIHGSEVGQFFPLILPKDVVLKDKQ